MKTNKSVLLFFMAVSLCLNLGAQVHLPLDDANGFTGAILMPGARGNAVRLNGYTSFKREMYSITDISTRQQTISLWCAVETYPMMNAAEAENAYTSIIENIDDAQHTGFAVRLSSQGFWRFEYYSDSWKLTLNAATLLPKYQWNHIVVTLDADQKKAYLYNNGQLVAQGNTMASLSTGTGQLLIGRENKMLSMGSFMLNTFNGLIDDIRIDNYVWEESKIKTDNAVDNAADLIYPQNAFYANILRPHFHGMPMMGWTNETHGMVYYNGKYHLFFQKNPNGPYMARLHWGHITSTDLCGWEEEKIAIAPSEAYDLKGCWSGCVFQDNYLTGGKPWIAYTGVDNGRATIDFATPQDDNLLNWNKQTNNPRINGRPAGLSDDFRDCYFFRNGDKAYMIVGSSKDGRGVATLHFFDGNGNLSNDGAICFTAPNSASSGTFFEMPNLTKIGDKWLFTATPLNTAVGVRTIYWVGTINDNGQFIPDNATPQTVELSGFARDGYGLLSPTICQVNGKTIALGIVPDKLASAVNYDMGWAHNYSLPREWALSSTGSLIQKPYSGLGALRKSTCLNETNTTLNEAKTVNVTNGLQVELDADFTVANSAVGFNLLDGTLKIFYEPSSNRLVVDMTGAPRRQNDVNVFNGYYASVLPRAISKGSKLNMHVYFDHSILDIFIGDEWASSIRIFPSRQPSNTVQIVGSNGQQVTRAAVYDVETTAKVKNYNLIDPSQTGISTLQECDNWFTGTCNTIIYDLPEASKVNIYDCLGKNLYNGSLSGSGSINQLPQGVVICTATNKNGTFYKKLFLH